MNKRIILLAAVCFLAYPTFGSEPGQQMDCSDITFGEPGHSCAVAVSQLPPSFIRGPGLGPLQPFFVDNEGNVYIVVTGNGPACPGWPYTDRWEVRRFNQDGSSSVVVSSESRCVPDGTVDFTESYSAPAFDPISGRILIPIWSSCFSQFAHCTNYEPRVWLAAINGFPTLPDVLSRKDHEHDCEEQDRHGSHQR